jgi:hypothetical protein
MGAASAREDSDREEEVDLLRDERLERAMRTDLREDVGGGHLPHALKKDHDKNWKSIDLLCDGNLPWREGRLSSRRNNAEIKANDHF